MNEARAPTDERLKEQVLAEYRKGAKPKELSEKTGISVNTIKSWIKRDKAKKTEDKSGAPGKDKGAPAKRKKGAPVGNKNAEGAGAPGGNQNALKHGGYAAVYWSALSDEEKEMIADAPTDEEALLIEQIQLFTVRERRLMLAIKKYTEAKGGQYISGVISFEDKRKFSSQEEEQLYKDIVEKKVKKEERLPGQKHSIQTSTGATIDLITRLEKELTSVQSKKTKAIDSLIRLRLENRKLNDAGKGTELVDDWIASIMGDLSEGGDPE